MDKRILKTKRNIKQTLINLLKEKCFEEISVKELCERAETSRITFYTHFSDKTELANNIIEDAISDARAEFYRLQGENNKDGDIVTEYMNILNCIFNTYYDNYDFFSNADENHSPTLSSLCSKFINENIGRKIDKDKQRLNLRYTPLMTCKFLSSGIRGFIGACREEGLSRDEVRLYTQELFKKLLESDVIRK